MAISYLNWNRETIDELSSDDFKTYRDFSAEKRRLLGEYAIAGMPGHWSQRACAGWNE